MKGQCIYVEGNGEGPKAVRRGFFLPDKQRVPQSAQLTNKVGHEGGVHHDTRVQVVQVGVPELVVDRPGSVQSGAGGYGGCSDCGRTGVPQLAGLVQQIL
jgi:hypothetical protein